MTKLFPTQNHPSFYRGQSIVYPVVSRRSGGVSIGINLSPSKRCNFACTYCQVNCQRLAERDILSQVPPEVDFKILNFEVKETVKAVLTGEIFSVERFRETPAEKRSLRDFAFSGDGEPTLSPQFAQAVRLVAKLRDELVGKSVKLVLITNATTLRSPATIEGCDALTEQNGEIWAKFDGLNEEVYRKINRSSIPYAMIVDNLTFAANRWPIKIQTMFLRNGSAVPTPKEIASYVGTLEQIASSGGNIAGLQLYTVARPPVESDVSALNQAELDSIADIVRRKTGLSTEVFYSR